MKDFGLTILFLISISMLFVVLVLRAVPPNGFEKRSVLESDSVKEPTDGRPPYIVTVVSEFTNVEGISISPLGKLILIIPFPGTGLAIWKTNL